MKCILVIGTGRCGTVSLSELLSAQPSVEIKHEMEPKLPWDKDLDTFHKKIEKIAKIQATVVGEAAYWNLPYVEDFISNKTINNVRVVVLKRNKEETIQSFIDKTGRAGPKYRDRHHWYDHDDEKWEKDPHWDPTFPTYDIEDKYKAIARYWEEYYDQVDTLISKYPQKIKLFTMQEVLNKKPSQKELFNFLGIENYEHKIPCQYNVIKEGGRD